MDRVDLLDITQADGAAILPVKAVPGAKRPGIVGVHGGALKVAVAEPPEGGAANRALCRLVARSLGLSRRDVTVHAGHSAPWKSLRCAGVTPDVVRERLETA